MSVDDHDHDHELLLPFEPVASKGGPYDDEAYVAGWQAASIDSALAQQVDSTGPLTVRFTATIYASNIKQIDLIAMRRGFTVEFENHDETWCFAHFMFAGE